MIFEVSSDTTTAATESYMPTRHNWLSEDGIPVETPVLRIEWPPDPGDYFRENTENYKIIIDNLTKVLVQISAITMTVKDEGIKHILQYDTRLVRTNANNEEKEDDLISFPGSVNFQNLDSYLQLAEIEKIMIQIEKNIDSLIRIANKKFKIENV